MDIIDLIRNKIDEGLKEEIDKLEDDRIVRFLELAAVNDNYYATALLMRRTKSTNIDHTQLFIRLAETASLEILKAVLDNGEEIFKGSIYYHEMIIAIDSLYIDHIKFCEDKGEDPGEYVDHYLSKCKLILDYCDGVKLDKLQKLPVMKEIKRMTTSKSCNSK